jgi:hypothetical protein
MLACRSYDFVKANHYHIAFVQELVRCGSSTSVRIFSSTLEAGQVTNNRVSNVNRCS